jgi:hypothetical protein
MVEGWYNEDYIILFDQAEVAGLTRSYGLPEFLPSCRVLGIQSWDDFIVADADDVTFTVPTIPLVAKYLKPYSLPKPLALQHAERLPGKIKWYIKPLAFGDDPQLGDNITWVSVSEHAKLVKWWNDRYRQVTTAAKV